MSLLTEQQLVALAKESMAFNKNYAMCLGMLMAHRHTASAVFGLRSDAWAEISALIEVFMDKHKKGSRK